MTSISVVIPYRDVEPYVGDLLVSLRRAVTPETQLIFVDDASSDRTTSLIEAAAPSLGEVVVLRNDENVGLAESRNRGMAVATGEHLFFLDADDWVDQDYFRRQSAALDRHGCDFVRIDQVRCFPNRRDLAEAPEPRCDQVVRAIDGILPDDRATMVDYPYAHSGAFHRRLLDAGLLGFHPELHTAEDRPWIWRLHLSDATYVHLSYPGYYYRRQVVTSLTQIGDRRQLDFIPSYHHVFDVVLAHPDAERYLLKLARQTTAVIAHHVGNADRLEPGLDAEMRAGARSLIDRIPTEVLDVALATSVGSRRRTIRRLQRGRAQSHPRSQSTVDEPDTL